MIKSSQQRALMALRGFSGTEVVEGNYPEAAVMVALSEGRDEYSVLLTRRAEHLRLHAGEAAFPGGKRDATDESLLATALREAQEEIALDPGCFELLCTLDQRLTRTDIKVTPFVGLVPENTALDPNPNEIDEVYSVPLSHFLQPEHLTMIELPYHGKLVSSPCFHYLHHEIWGVTALTLIDLVEKVFGTRIYTD